MLVCVYIRVSQLVISYRNRGKFEENGLRYHLFLGLVFDSPLITQLPELLHSF